ncbi:MAG TPA: TrbC/VirB2 family protein [Bdellovibrio sp.]|uniref:TrbC/VirB2 family protein n=1 Tax=Bdellovibrio sp. TaxID=28201 RepID=UPI002EFDAC67
MRKQFIAKRALLCLFLFFPVLALADVEGSLRNVQNELVGTFVPIAATLGFIFAGISYISGNPNGRNHMILACIGAAVAFGASSIMSLIQSVIH